MPFLSPLLRSCILFSIRHFTIDASYVLCALLSLLLPWQRPLSCCFFILKTPCSDSVDPLVLSWFSANNTPLHFCTSFVSFLCRLLFHFHSISQPTIAALSFIAIVNCALRDMEDWVTELRAACVHRFPSVVFKDIPYLPYIGIVVAPKMNEGML